MSDDRTAADEKLTTLEEHARGTDASEPLAVVDSWEAMGLLPPDLFAALTPEEQDVYLELIEAEHGHVWSLADSPKQLLAEALAPKVDYLYYGGAAGGGKTELAMYHVHDLSLRFPGHTTLMLRTTLPELRRSIIRRFSVRLIELGLQQVVKLRKIDNMTAFYYPNGSVIEFGYCISGETLVRMGDGSYCRMDEIQPGDTVDTLEGPRRVTSHWRVGFKPAVEITLPSGHSAVASESHRLLASDGSWTLPGDLSGRDASGRRDTCTSTRWSKLQLQVARRPLSRSSALARLLAALPPVARESVLSDGGEVQPSSSREASRPRRQDEQPPREWSGQLLLHGPEVRSASLACSSDLAHGYASDLNDSSTPGSPPSCPTSPHCDGGPLRRGAGVARGSTPSRAGVEASRLGRWLRGGPRLVPRRTRSRGNWYFHPYTKELRRASVDVQPSSDVRIVRVGERDLWDMTVEGASHYVSQGGIVHQNCSNDEQVGQYLSAEYDLLVMDEASLFSAYAIQMVTTRVRTTRRKRKMGIYPHVMYLSNPGGPAHLYLRKFCYDSTERGAQIAIFDTSRGIAAEDILEGRAKPVRYVPMPETPEEARQLKLDDLSDDEVTVAFIPARVADNPHIDTGYRRRLAALPEVRRRQMLEGDMMIAEGSAFPEWDNEIHTCEPFVIPADWDRLAGIDWGWRDPACIVWGAWSPEGTCYIYREDKVTRLGAQEQADRWMALEGKEKVRVRLADPNTHQSQAGGSGVPIATQWRLAGMNTRKASNPRIPGWANVHAYLANRPADEPDGEPGPPRLVVFRTCPYSIEQLSSVPADKHQPEDVDTHVDDHGADAIRYLLGGVPIREIKRAATKRAEGYGSQGRVERYVDRQKRKR